MTDNSPFVQQPDGTYSPSADLIQRYRENPEAYPNLIEDAAVLSGITEEEAARRLNNTLGRGNAFSRALTYNARQGITFAQGAGRAVGRGISKVGELTGSEGIQDAGDWVQETADAVNPRFNEDYTTSEWVNDGVGQAAPAVAAGMTPAGWAAGLTVGAGVATMTFDDEDNVMNFLDEITEGDLPEWMVVNDDDDSHTAFMKHLAINLVLDGATLGGGRVAANLYRTIQSVPTGFDLPQLRDIADQHGIPLRETDEAAPAARGADEVGTDGGRVAVSEEEITTSPESVRRMLSESLDRELADANMSPQQRETIRQRDRQVFADLLRMGRGDLTPNEGQVPLDSIKEFRGRIMDRVGGMLSGASDLNAGSREAIARFLRDNTGELQRHSETVFTALYRGDYEQVLDLLKNAPAPTNQIGRDVDIVYRNTLQSEVAHAMSERSLDVIRAIREDPNLATRETWLSFIREASQAQLDIAELHRITGRATGTGLQVRKNLTPKNSGGRVMDDYIEVEDQLAQSLRDRGLDIRATSSEYVFGNALKLEEAGFDSYRLLDTLLEQFEQFDQVRQGTLHNMQRSKVYKMTKAERQAHQNTMLKAYQELHVSALLGQLSTTLLEFSSNSLSLALGPISREVIGGGRGISRAIGEYAGYKAGWSHTWGTFKQSIYRNRGVVDDFDIMDGSHSGLLDLQRLRDEGKHLQVMALRAWQGAATVNMAAADAAKALRGFGIAYADGAEMAARQGITDRKTLNEMATRYAQSKFNENGRLLDHGVLHEAQRELWQNAFDTRYMTGGLAQQVDDLVRQNPNPWVGVPGRFVLPVFRTLVNIGGHSAQTLIPPGMPAALRAAAKAADGVSGGNVLAMQVDRLNKSAKFLDDFTGRNGAQAQYSAQARQRMGMMALGTAFVLPEAFDNVELTGPSMFGRWDVNSARFARGYAPSTLTIGDQSFDLTRFLPFSAPLMLAGTMRDMMREQELQQQGGNYSSRNYAADLATSYAQSLGYTFMAMLSDAAAFRGIGDFMDAVNEAVTEGSGQAITRWSKRAMGQLVPAIPRMVGKNTGIVDGDWDLYRGEHLMEEIMAASGLKVGYKQRDFLGKPRDDRRYSGLDPYNRREVEYHRDPLYREFAEMNRDGDLSLRQHNPRTVFDARFWNDLGISNNGFDMFAREMWGGGNIPSLTQLSLKDGRNAWEAFEDQYYQGRIEGAAIDAATSQFGTRLDFGRVEAQEGMNLEDTLRALIETPEYQASDPTARVAMWRAVDGIFRHAARDLLREQMVIPEELFESSRYGTPDGGGEPLTMWDTRDAVREGAADIHTTVGTPERRRFLDQIFSID